MSHPGPLINRLNCDSFLHVCLRTGPGFPSAYVMIFCVQWFEVVGTFLVVRFLVISGSDHYHCLNFLFIKNSPNNKNTMHACSFTCFTRISMDMTWHIYTKVSDFCFSVSILWVQIPWKEKKECQLNNLTLMLG